MGINQPMAGEQLPKEPILTIKPEILLAHKW